MQVQSLIIIRELDRFSAVRKAKKKESPAERGEGVSREEKR